MFFATSVYKPFYSKIDSIFRFLAFFILKTLSSSPNYHHLQKIKNKNPPFAQDQTGLLRPFLVERKH